MEIINKKLSEIKAYENNPRNNDAAVDAVAASIRKFGFKQPIVIDTGGVIVAGHTRAKAAKKLGMKTVPCVVADDLTPEQIRAFRLADNKTAELADWDLDKLDEELAAITDIDMSEFGFDDLDEAVDDDAGDPPEDDETPEVEEETTTKIGDIFQLGSHRLMCGDSLDAQQMTRLMDGAVADLVFTDPPYGAKKESEGVLNDNLNYVDLLEFNRKWIELSFAHLKNNGSWYCWGYDRPLMDIYAFILLPMIKNSKITLRNLLTWDKGAGRGQMAAVMRSYVRADEKCLFVMTGVQEFSTNADNYYEGWEPIRSYLAGEMEKCGGSKNWEKALGNQMGKYYFTKSQFAFPTREAYEKLQKFGREYDGAFSKDYNAFSREYDAFKKEYDELKKEYDASRAFFDNTIDNMNNVWHFTPVGGNTQEKEDGGYHPTPKPVALCERAVQASSRPEELILDMFGGSGSTLIAAEKNGRRCCMMELDPHYVDVIVRRWEAYTGKKAVKLSEGEWTAEEGD